MRFLKLIAFLIIWSIVAYSFGTNEAVYIMVSFGAIIMFFASLIMRTSPRLPENIRRLLK